MDDKERRAEGRHTVMEKIFSSWREGAKISLLTEGDPSLQEHVDSLLADGTIVARADGKVLTAEEDLKARLGLTVIEQYDPAEVAHKELVKAVRGGAVHARESGGNVLLSRTPIDDGTLEAWLAAREKEALVYENF